MVVNRKQPVVPVPPISRTASSQPLPTKRQTRNSNAASSAQATKPPRDDQKSNGRKIAVPHSLRRTKSSKSEKKQKSRTFIDYLILFLLSAFTCYSFYVCRPNPLFSSPSYEPQPSLCRALATYRTHVLDPYVLPPIKHTLHYAHQISEPYVEDTQKRLSVYLEPAKVVIDTLTPYVKSSIRATKSVWKNTVIPLYTQTLRPYYETAVVPRYIRYVKPTIVPLQNKVQKLFAHYVSNPVRSKTNFILHKLHHFYTLHVDPYMRIARPYIQSISNTTRTTALNVSAIYATYLHPSLLKVWNVTHPIFCTTWRNFFRLFFRLTDGICTYVKWGASEVGVYRRQYVDRHVDRILEQVADPKANGNVDEAASSPSLVVETKIASEAQEVPGISPHYTATADTLESATSSIAATSTSNVPSTATSASMHQVEATINSVSDTPATTIPIPMPLESEVEAISSAVEPSADHASSEREEPDALFDSTFTSIPTHLTTPSASADEVSRTMESAVTAEPTPSISELDLDDFLREIGVGNQASPVTPEDTYDEPSARPKTEEERLAETAAKRADIVGRHEKWFEKLHAAVEEVGDGLVRTLQSLRDDAAEEVRRLGTRLSSKAVANDAENEPVKVSRSLVLVEKDGERLIKGLEGYLRKAENRCNDWKIPKDAPDDEAKTLKHDIASKEKEAFSDIVSKVETKFSVLVDNTRLEVHKWYAELKEREAGEVLRASAVIKSLAEEAQEDLGMDYSWLNDVTYLDWQRYHDLSRVHDTFETTVRQIANGTSTDPTPPSDPVVKALDELDRDLQDIIVGFNYALSGVRSRGLKVFNLRPLNGEGDDDDDDDDDGFFVVRDNEKRVVDLRGVDLGKVELKKEAVGVLPIKQDGDEVEESEKSIGILPVPEAPLPEDGQSGFDASQIIIGKDKVQIEEALRDIPLETPGQRHTEL